MFWMNCKHLSHDDIQQTDLIAIQQLKFAQLIANFQYKLCSWKIFIMKTEFEALASAVNSDADIR